MLAVAMGAVFHTAMAGRCDSRPDLAARPIPLRIEIPAVPGELAHRLFEPLGWTVDTEPIPLDQAFPDWGDSRYVTLTTDRHAPARRRAEHLYVLLPVLDNGKHYWVSEDEVTKLLRAGDGWLAAHPDRRLISDRYLAHQRAYVSTALAQLAESDDALVTPVVEPLARRRRAAVLAVLTDAGAHRVLDLGCGDGALLRDLVAEPRFTEIVGSTCPRARWPWRGNGSTGSPSGNWPGSRCASPPSPTPTPH